MDVFLFVWCSIVTQLVEQDPVLTVWVQPVWTTQLRVGSLNQTLEDSYGCSFSWIFTTGIIGQCLIQGKKPLSWMLIFQAC